MSHVRRFDHIGITVADLDAATHFFVNGVGRILSMSASGQVCSSRAGIGSLNTSTDAVFEGTGEIHHSSMPGSAAEPSSRIAAAALSEAPDGLGLRFDDAPLRR